MLSKRVPNYYALPAILISTLLVVIVIYGWTEPTSSPPSGNVSAPLNISTTTQYKGGALGIGGLFRGYSDAIFDGNVGIGTTTPEERLDVAGAVKLGNTVSACDASHRGVLRYVSGGGAGVPDTIQACLGNDDNTYGWGNVVAGQTRIQIFNISGTWTNPAGYGAGTTAEIVCWGGGGGGAGTGQSSGEGGGSAGGGGGGALSIATALLSSLPSSVPVTIGPGGATGNEGSAGGSSSFGSILTAGAGGGGGSNRVGGTGGIGTYNGSKGGNPNGGAAGSGGGYTGGADTGYNHGSAIPGNAPGGGGGAAGGGWNWSYSGGAPGAPGKCIVTITNAP